MPAEFAEPETEADRYRASRLADEGDRAGAEAVYRAILTKFPNSSLTYSELSAVLQREGRIDEEWDAASQAYKLAQRSPLAVMAIAIAAGARKDHNAAISWYSLAISLDSNYGLAYYGRGIERFWIGEYRESICDFRRVAPLMPGSKYSSDAARHIAMAEGRLNGRPDGADQDGRQPSTVICGH